MSKINITSGEYLNNFLKNKHEGVFIAFNEVMIQGNLSYPLFNEDFINQRCLTHKVDNLQRRYFHIHPPA